MWTGDDSVARETRDVPCENSYNNIKVERKFTRTTIHDSSILHAFFQSGGLLHCWTKLQ